MKYFVKRSVCLVFALVMVLTSVFCVSAISASAADNDGAQVVSEGDTEIMPRADEIVWRYTTMNGILYKRRWNVTREEWYDRAWVPA